MNRIAKLAVISLLMIPANLMAQIAKISKVNHTTIEIQWKTNQSTYFDFYGDNIVRVFQDTTGKEMRKPQSKPEAEILVSQPRKVVTSLNYQSGNGITTIETPLIRIAIQNQFGTFSITNLSTGKKIVELLEPVNIEKEKTTLILREFPEEYFFGGGVQNGRFSHKGKKIEIENENSWTDGGVASPTPFYWSTNGYGLMWYTFKRGQYDFGSKMRDTVILFHETNYLDVFFMIDDGASRLLNDYYQLTGNPVLIPKFGFYEGHLNAYNRDYWKEDTTGILFEDGKKYKESQKDNGGIRESLNGELNNYQFSARAVIDRYKNHNMPLGWILPNDGYGAGYGQTSTLDSNIGNLKIFGDYARKHGVQIGLWTQSDLHPKPGISALLQRDLNKEVGIAGVRVLKTDVAWVGAGYSFGLSGIADAAGIMTREGNDARPFIITLDGWAGTQRYGTIWTGDQTGGQWEYIRFHIPTYLGSGLSGQPNITSDMDGIFGGRNPEVNIRDFQWKTFTPMQLNMDGWGLNPKYPFSLGEPATSINRMYLKWKSELIPYSYSLARNAVDDLPMIRAMFLYQSNPYTLSIGTQYQFLYGPWFLIAPIYQNTRADSAGNDIRNNIYLPDGKWIDYFTGDEYSGNQIINNFDAPLWKLPVFIKKGAIIPLTNPNNHVDEINKHHRIYEIYPNEKSSFTEYDDDGVSEKYREGQFTTTLIESEVTNNNRVQITVFPTKGNFVGFEKMKSTEFRINVTQKPKQLYAYLGTVKINLKRVTSEEMLRNTPNSYYYAPWVQLNRFATEGSEFSRISIRKNPEIFVNIESTDITKNSVRLQIDGYAFVSSDKRLARTGVLSVPAGFTVPDKDKTAYTLTPHWNTVPEADYYEIRFRNMLYSTIRENKLRFENLNPETPYHFELRAVNKAGHSAWVSLQVATNKDPLQFAIRGISASVNIPSQGRDRIGNLFDFDESDMWHSKWDTAATPFEITIDLKSINHLDKIQYLPRLSGFNGIWQKGTIYYSTDRNIWKDAGTFNWQRDNHTKEFVFSQKPTARYLRINVSEGFGKFGSGRELYIFKVPGSQSYIPGDINNDGLIDFNDLTSYMNYTGLRYGDADFEGYISNGDINQNGLIDAFDISNVATKLDGGIREEKNSEPGGTVILSTPKLQYKSGEIIEILVKGVDLKNVNAFSFAIPYNAHDYEYVGLQPLNILQMQNFTNDRLHSNGQKSLYPTFVNVGNQETLNGNKDLCIIKFKAKKNLLFNLRLKDGILVNKNLSEKTF